MVRATLVRSVRSEFFPIDAKAGASVENTVWSELTQQLSLEGTLADALLGACSQERHLRRCGNAARLTLAELRACDPARGNDDAA
jgi:hypothetical protein